MSSNEMETTADLLNRIQAGDNDARERLYARLLPPLRRWAQGRLPVYARDLADTDDLVQQALIRSLTRISSFESRGEGSFLAYLHRILLNLLRDEFRRKKRLPVTEPLPDELALDRESTLTQTLAVEALDAYERALGQITDAQRDAVMLRIEFGFTYPEIAQALGNPSPNSARMLVSRALARVADLMETSPETNSRG